jgi:hypothetical protein
MSKKWQAAREAAKEANGGGFLKLLDGEKVIVAFMGEPQPRRMLWIDGKSLDPESVEGGLAMKADLKLRPRTSFEVDVFNVAIGTKQSWTMSPTTLEMVGTVLDKYGESHAYEITRKGAGLDTTYTCLPERPLTVEEQARLNRLAGPASDSDKDSDGVPF